MVNFLGSFNIVPSLPENLEKLREISYNLHWTWNPDARELYRRLDRELWEETNHNPVLVLGRISQQRLEEVSKEDGFIAHLHRVHARLTEYLSEKTWFQKNSDPSAENFNIAYFSAEFGLAECLQTYSGGLGVLAGDHLKAASDLGIPLIGIGLLYKVGYFQQYLTSDGWQHERYEINDFENLPMKLVLKDNNEPLKISVPMAERTVYFQVWKIQVGRVPLFLLDTNIPENNEQDRKITETLYGGNVETRIQQEIVLGIGGIRTMHAMGINLMVCHMNEGHSAFLSLERIRVLIAQGLSFNEAREIGYYSNIFTTHTPVPAGIDVFANELIEKYFGAFYRNELHISDKQFYSLGTIYRDREPNVFNMAHLAMNTAGFVNGVSKLHGEVSKKMWVSGFKDVPFNEIPIGYITNGVHTRTHISREMEELLLQYIGERWLENPDSVELWKRIDNIPDEELWRTHERRRERLVAFARRRLLKQIRMRGGSQFELAAASEVLDPTVLTIGFARRFATYKRATLIFKDIERLADIVNNKEFPVQFIIAGKAHPKDEEGKKLIQEIYQMANEERFRRKIVFLENYDMNVARYLVEGCDIWLNNPRRPLEASGTSGMKVIANGGLNFSVLDGWWDEGFDPEVGWKIGNGEEYADPDYQDEIESHQLYDTLEREIIPTFYERAHDRLPRGWIARVKNSMRKLGPFFNTNRMVTEYFQKYYQPAYERRKSLIDKKYGKAKELAEWKQNIINNWSAIKVKNIDSNSAAHNKYVGEEMQISAEVVLGSLTPEDVEVQLYYGPLENQDNPANNSSVVMHPASKKQNDGSYKYSGSILCEQSGRKGYTVRVVPKNKLLIHPFELGVVYWA